MTHISVFIEKIKERILDSDSTEFEREQKVFLNIEALTLVEPYAVTDGLLF